MKRPAAARVSRVTGRVVLSCVVVCVLMGMLLGVNVVSATIPTADFTGLWNTYVTSTTSWCVACAAFSTNCIQGCAGDTGIGGACPSDACPRVFTFVPDTTTTAPVWNINVATSGSPYRAFSYIPLCTAASQCTEPFVFSFDVKYTAGSNNANPLFSNQMDYLKLLFWGDGHNILGVKNGLLLGIPGGGTSDLVGSTTAPFSGFSSPFVSDTWYNIAVTMTYNAGATPTISLAFALNGQAIGNTGTVGFSSTGLQFGAYVWGGNFFNIQYRNLKISAVGSTTVATTALPTQLVTTKAVATTATPTTAKATTAQASGVASSSSTITSYVFTLAADPGQNGGKGINNIQCNQGTLTATINLLASVNVNNIHAYQPMAENGLPQIQMSFFLNGAPATGLKLQNSFNVGATSVTQANMWIFDLADDGPHPGAQMTLGTCTAGALPVVQASFATNSKLTTTGLPNGADGGPPTPAITLPTTPQLVNALPAAFVFVPGATFAAPPTAAVTTKPGTATTAAPSAITSYVFTFAADPGQNGGMGINALQCNNGWLRATINLLASVNVNNIHAYQPMAENGLPQIQMSFLLNGQPGAVTVMNSFNVATSMAQGNTWIFDLADDGPHPGGQFILGQCSGNTIPTITVSFATNSVLTTAGLPNGADGGPPTPPITTPTKPTLVNALPAQFNGGTAAGTVISTTSVPTMPTAVPTMAQQTTAAMGTGSITIFISANAYQPQCNNGAWTMFFQGYQVSLTLTSGAVTSTGAPMDENGAPQVNMLGTFFLDGVAAPLMVSNAVNVANSKAINTNVWSFNLLNDQPNIGAAFTLTPTTPCTFQSALPRITSFFTTSGAVIMAPGGNGNPPVTNIPSVVNQLQAANLASPNMAPTGKATMSPATLPPTAAATTAAPTPAVSTINCNGCTGTSIITIAANNAFTPQCNNGVWMLFGIGFQVTVQTSGNGMSVTGPPMNENGAGLYTIDSYWFLNGQPSQLTPPSTFNIAQVSTNGNVFSFQTLDDQGTIGGSFGLTPATPCTFGTTPVPKVTIAFGSKTQFTTPGSAQFGIPVITAIPQLVNKLNAANNGGVLNIVGATSTSAMPTITTATTKAAATTKPTTAKPTTKPAAVATTAAPVMTAGAAITIKIGALAGNYAPMCSNGQWALFGQGYSVSVTVSDGQGTTNTAQPMDESGAGMETIAAAWYVNGVATKVTAQNTFNVGNSMTSGNQWLFTLLNDQPNIGGSILLAVNPPCTNGQAAPSITTAFAMAQPNTAITTPGGNGVPVVTAIPTVVNNLPIFEQTAATWPTLPAGSVTSPPQVVTTAVPAATTGATINQQINTNVATQGYCTGAFLTVSVAMVISQNGMAPMAENGLPAVTGTVTYNSKMVTIVSFSAYNMQPSLNGAMFTFNEADDQANVGGQLTINVPCSYTTGVPAAGGVAISYTAQPVTLNGATSPVAINAVPNSVRTTVDSPTIAPMPDTGVTTVTQDPNTPAEGVTTSSSSMSTIIIIIAAAAGGVLLIVAIAAAVYYYRKKNGAKQTTANVKNIDMATRV